MKSLILLSLAAQFGWSAISATVRGTTPTQAILSYTLTAPTGAACMVEISESPSFAPLDHDVDSTLFPGSNLDSRSGSITNGNTHIFAGGTRGGAQIGSDGKWYSRALAANTLHYFRINNDLACDTGGGVTGTFTTANVPLGRLFNDPIPAAPGGGTAWPHVYGTSHAALTDPQTGIKMVPVSAAGDQPNSQVTGASFGNPYDPGATWVCAGNTLPCTFSASNSARLILPINLGIFIGANYEELSTGYLSWIQAHLTMSCSGGTCGSASAANRTVDFCLTVNNGGLTCATNIPQQVLGTSSSTFTAGGDAPGLADWTLDASLLNHVLISQHSADVTISGTTVTYADSTNGDTFQPIVWGNGTQIVLNGSGCTNQTFTIATVTDSFHLTLTSAPTCSSATYTLTPFALLVWKDTSSADAFSITAAQYDDEVDYEQQLDSSPMQNFANEAGGPVITLNGCAGYLAYHTVGWYWESSACGIVNYLGQWEVPYVPAVWGIELVPVGGIGGACVFDPVNNGVVTCYKDAFNSETGLVKITYTGDYTSVPPGTILPACNGSNPPCLTFTTLETSLVSKLRTYSPAFAADCCSTFIALDGGCPDGTLLMRAPLFSQQGVEGWYAVYDPSIANFVAARKSTGFYQVTGSGFHSAMPRCSTAGGGRVVGYGQQLGGVGNLNAPISGNDSLAGSGPYRVRVPAGLSGSTVACPTRPANSPIAAADWPGGVNNSGNQCTTDTVAANILADPSPYVATLSISATNGSPSVSTTGAFLRSYTGKTIIIGSAHYVIQSFTDSGDVLLNQPFSGICSGCSAVIEAEPPCSVTGLLCDNPADYGLRALAPGDKLFVGAPTPGVSGHDNFADVESEALQVLLVNGNSITWQRGYGGHGVSSWPGSTYLYQDAGVYNFILNQGLSVGYDFFWDTKNNPDGSNGVAFPDRADLNPPQGHGALEPSATAAFYSNGCNLTYTQWNGFPISDCYISRYGPNFTYTSSLGTVSAMTAPFSGQMGLGNPNEIDTHASYPHESSPQWFLDARPLDGSDTAPSTGTQVSGTLYKFTYSQRGFLSASGAILADKILPTLAACGQHPMLNVSGPGAAIDGTFANSYKYLTVVNANEGVIGSNPGDLYVNCPGAAVIGSFAPPIGANGGNVIDITVAPQGPWVQGNVQVDFSAPSPAGNRTRWLGHTLSRYRWFSAFWNVRAPPDDGAMLSQVVGLDGFKSATMMTILPPIVLDSINGADFVPVAVQLNPPAGLSIDHALVEFGYQENGAPASGLFCTPRQEPCVKGSQTGNLFNYESSESGAYSGQPCSSTCAIVVPGISGRSVYYRVKFLQGSTVKLTTALEIMPVP